MHQTKRKAISITFYYPFCKVAEVVRFIWREQFVAYVLRLAPTPYILRSDTRQKVNRLYQFFPKLAWWDFSTSQNLASYVYRPELIGPVKTFIPCFAYSSTISVTAGSVIPSASSCICAALGNSDVAKLVNKHCRVFSSGNVSDIEPLVRLTAKVMHLLFRNRNGLAAKSGYLFHEQRKRCFLIEPTLYDLFFCSALV